MKKSRILVFIIAITFLVIQSSFVYATTTTNDYQNNADYYISRIINTSSQTDDFDALIDDATHLYDLKATIDENELIELISNKKLDEKARLTFFQLGYDIDIKNNTKWQNMCNQILEHSSEPESLRIEAIWQIEGDNCIGTLCNYSMGENDAIAFQALKRLSELDPISANSISETILERGLFSHENVFRKALRIKANNICKEHDKDQESSFIDCCEQLLLDNPDNDLLIDSIFFSLYDLNSQKSHKFIIENDCFDTILKNYVYINSPFEGNMKLFDEEGSKATSYYGYAIYRDGAFINALGVWHAGMMVKSKGSYAKSVIHVKSEGTDIGPIYDNYNGFLGSNNFKGVYKPGNSQSYSSSDKTNVVVKAKELIGENIQYTVLKQLQWHLAYSDGTKKGEPTNIFRMRCDGVVEYCFEYYNKRIWGSNTLWNISIKNSQNANHHSGTSVTPNKQAAKMTKVTSSAPL